MVWSVEAHRNHFKYVKLVLSGSHSDLSPVPWPLVIINGGSDVIWESLAGECLWWHGQCSIPFPLGH